MIDGDRQGAGWTLALAIVVGATACTPSKQPGVAIRRPLATLGPGDISPEQRLDIEVNVRSPVAAETVIIASGGGVHLLVWTTVGDTLYAARVRASDGAVLDARFPLAPPDNPCRVMSRWPRVAWNGAVFLVVWHAGFGAPAVDELLCGTRVGADGTVMDGSPKVIAQSKGMYAAAAVGSDGTNFLVAWADAGDSRNGLDLVATRIRGSDGAALDEKVTTLSAAPGGHFGPRVGFDGSNYMVAWFDATEPRAITYTRVRPSDGQPLDGAGVRLVDPGTQVSSFDMAFDGTNYLIVWRDAFNLRGVRIRAVDATVVDATPVLLATDVRLSSDPALAWSGTRYLVAWPGSASVGHTQLLAQRLSAGAVTLGAPIVIDELPSTGDSVSVSLAASDGRHLIAWNRPAEQPPSAPGLQRPVDVVFAGLPTNRDTVLPGPVFVSLSSSKQDRPSLSFDGRYHLVTWHDRRGSMFQIRGARVRDSDRRIMEPAGMGISPVSALDQLYPRSASNGTVHLVAWADRTGLRAARVNGSDGMLLPAAVSADANPGVWASDWPRWAVASDGRDFLMVWSDGDGPTSNTCCRVARVKGEDGTLMDVTPRQIPGPSGQASLRPSLVFAGSHYVLTWQQRNTDGRDVVHALRLGLDGAPVATPVPLSDSNSLSANVTKSLSVAGSGIVWSVWEGGALPPDSLQRQLWGRRMRVSDGTLLDAAAVSLTALFGRPTRNDTSDAIAFDGEHFVLLWPARQPAREDRLALSRIDTAGTALDTEGVAIAGGEGLGAYNPALSAGRSGALLAAYVRQISPPPSEDRIHLRWLGRGLPPDAGPGAAPDAAPPDTTADVAGDVPPVDPPDTTAQDGGGANDAQEGDTDARPRGQPEGCGCRLGGRRSTGASLPVLLGLALLLRRRSRSRRSGRCRD